jgi:hypothetical protein
MAPGGPLPVMVIAFGMAGYGLSLQVSSSKIENVILTLRLPNCHYRTRLGIPTWAASRWVPLRCWVCSTGPTVCTSFLSLSFVYGTKYNILLHAGLGAFFAPLAATHFAQVPHWSYHYLISLGFAVLNIVVLCAVFRFRGQDGSSKELFLLFSRPLTTGRHGSYPR